MINPGLGYNVADFLETMQYFTVVWHEYMEGRTTIEHVIEEYNKYGFDSHQDVPGNWMNVTSRGSAKIPQLFLSWLFDHFWSFIKKSLSWAIFDSLEIFEALN